VVGMVIDDGCDEEKEFVDCMKKNNIYTGI
jgi:hypothetical protein